MSCIRHLEVQSFSEQELEQEKGCEQANVELHILFVLALGCTRILFPFNTKGIVHKNNYVYYKMNESGLRY